MSNLVFDLSKEGLLCVLKPYQIAVMHCFWEKEKPMLSREVHLYLQELGGEALYLQELGEEAARSRGAVINFLNAMVDEGFLDYVEPCNGDSSRRVYRLNAMSVDERTFRNEIRLKFDEKLRHFWKSED